MQRGSLAVDLRVWKGGFERSAAFVLARTFPSEPSRDLRIMRLCYTSALWQTLVVARWCAAVQRRDDLERRTRVMFDAYFSPPFLQPDDAVQMARFGVTHCLLALTSAHCKGPSIHRENLDANHPQASPIARQAHAQRVLRDAGIHVSIADAISPHLEPERSWEAQWHRLVSRIAEGSVHALGTIRFMDVQDRGLDILDRHLALSESCGVPLLVKMPTHIDAEDRKALLQRAHAHAERWYWVLPDLRFAYAALRRNQGVILSPHRTPSADDIVAMLTALSPRQRKRLAIGSSQGRGLNPFALASMEIALDQHAPALEGGSVLQGGTLAHPRRAVRTTRRVAETSSA